MSRLRKRRSRGLEESRLAALEERIDADLASGEHARLVGELEALVREHPLRERFAAQLMLALYRSGRQADALEAYRDARRRTARRSSGSSPGARFRSSSERSWPTTRRWSRPPGAPRDRCPRPRGAGGAARALIAGRGSGAAGGDRRGGGEAGELWREHRAGGAELGGGDRQCAATASSRRSPVGARPGPIAFGSGSLWVANLDDQTISRVDPRTSADAAHDPRSPAPPLVSPQVLVAVWVVDEPGDEQCPGRSRGSRVRHVWHRGADRQRRPGRAGGDRHAGQLGVGRAIDGPADAPRRDNRQARRAASIRTPVRPGSRSARGRCG